MRMAEIKADVILLTVTDVEAQTLLDLAENRFGRNCKTPHFSERMAYYDFGNVGHARTLMVRSEMGSTDPDGSLATVQECINLFNPDVVISVGIAFGIDEEKQKIGQVLVSKQLHPYDLQRIGQDELGKIKIISRGPKVDTPVSVLSRFRAGALEWKGGDVKFGLMLSGSKLVDNRDYREMLHTFEPEAIGGEMEGSGVYAAASRYKKDWIVIKGICDWADGNKRRNKKLRQSLAAEKSAVFVLFVLEQGGFTRTPSGPTSLEETNEIQSTQIEIELRDMGNSAIELSDRIRNLRQDHAAHPSTIKSFSEIDTDIQKFIDEVRRKFEDNHIYKNKLTVESYLEEVEAEMVFLRKEFAEASRIIAANPFAQTSSNLSERIKRARNMLLYLSKALLKPA